MQTWSDLKSSPLRLAGLVVTLSIVAVALAGPDITGYDFAQQNLSATFLAPCSEHWLGTDHLGRDMAARLAAGARITLSLAVLAVLSAALPGTLLGIAAAWSGGWVDRALNALAASILAVPGLLLVLMLAAISPGTWWALYVGLALTLWVEWFRYSRAAAARILSSPAVEASRLLGFDRLYILRRHVWPELALGLTTLASFGAATTVTAVATLGFVGVGLRPPAAEWGIMMTEFLPYWRQAPWLILQPIICLTTSIGAFHLLAGRRPT